MIHLQGVFLHIYILALAVASGVASTPVHAFIPLSFGIVILLIDAVVGTPKPGGLRR